MHALCDQLRPVRPSTAALLALALLVTGQSEFSDGLPPPVLREAQIVGVQVRVSWDFWEPTDSCSGGIFELAYLEGCDSQPSTNDSTNGTSNGTFACTLPCRESTATVPLIELEVESNRSYSFFLRVRCNMQMGDMYSYYYSYYSQELETVEVTTNYSAPLCIHSNSSRIATFIELGASSIFARFIPPFRDCFTDSLYNVSISPGCTLGKETMLYMTNELDFVITDLEPNTFYQVNVQGYCDDRWIDSEPLCNKTFSVPIEVVAVTANSTSVTVRWNAYEGIDSECSSVANYTVSLFTDSFSLASLTGQSPLHVMTAAANSTMVMVGNLEENTEYFVYLRAFCILPSGRNVFAEQIYRATTIVPLFEIDSVTPGVNDAYLTWAVPPCNEPTYDVVAQVGCIGGSDATEMVRRSSRNYTTISSFLPYTFYDFTVISHCNATYQTRSQHVCARTDSAPPKITGISAGITTVSISWERSTCNSFIYEINITTGCETMLDSNVEVYRVFNVTSDGGTAPNSTSVFDLLPGTVYGVKIRSYCVGESHITRYSDVTCAMTMEPDIECNSSVPFFALFRNSEGQVVSNQLVTAIFDPVSNGNTYFGVDPEEQLFLLKVNVLGLRGLLPFGRDFGGMEYEYSYRSSSYYGLQYTLPKPLPFFDEDRSILYINARGFISIGEPYLNPWSLTPFPLTGDVPMVAAFWWWYYTRVHIHSYQQGSSEFDDAVVRVVGDRLRQFNSVNSTFRPETVVSITWSLVSVL